MKKHFIVCIGFSDTGFSDIHINIDASDITLARLVLKYLVRSHFSDYEDSHPKTRYIRLEGATGKITRHLVGTGNMPDPANIELPTHFREIDWEELLSANM
ncbi:hypothetical protein [Rheinheimera sp. MM224]|uniref:hypothetical protein n=1 Tax=Rheinheimera sp. MM224 TaxID=3019969 RepID=UPI0021F8C968|nr:hypothetical protein [Rheinheimera sp. MM224]CAI3802986.1 hypothetical protein JAMGFMIE_03245 [Rheinheimera sp. MM224]